MINQYNLTDDIYQLPDIINFPTKEVHIVCPALKKNSLCSYLLVNKCEMDIAEVGKMCDTVNYKKETGCLFPRYHLSLFPTYDAIKDLDIERVCEGIVKDVMEANADFYKNTKMIIVVDDYQWDSAEIFLEYFEQNLIISVNHILKQLDCYIPK
jgi:hypothetical protein